jgi:hypothetical protein
VQTSNKFNINCYKVLPIKKAARMMPNCAANVKLCNGLFVIEVEFYKQIDEI